jgi:hypothetical protein
VDVSERDVQALQMREMSESRKRLQEQYNVQVRQAADTKMQVSAVSSRGYGARDCL